MLESHINGFISTSPTRPEGNNITGSYDACQSLKENSNINTGKGIPVYPGSDSN